MIGATYLCKNIFLIMWKENIRKSRIAVAAGYRNYTEYVKGEAKLRRKEAEDEIRRQSEQARREADAFAQKLLAWHDESSRLWEVVQDLFGRADEEGQAKFREANKAWEAHQETKPTNYL